MEDGIKNNNDMISKLNSNSYNLFKVIKVSYDNAVIEANKPFLIEKEFTLPTGYKAIGICGQHLGRNAGITYTMVDISDGHICQVGGWAGSNTYFNGYVEILLCTAL